MKQVGTFKCSRDVQMLHPAFSEGWNDAQRGVFNPDRIDVRYQWRYERGWAFRRYVERNNIKGIKTIRESKPGKVAPRIMAVYLQAGAAEAVI